MFRENKQPAPILIIIYLGLVILIGRLTLSIEPSLLTDNYFSLFQQTVFNLIFLFVLPYFLFCRSRCAWLDIYFRFTGKKFFWLILLVNALISIILAINKNHLITGKAVFIILFIYTVNIFWQEIFFRGFLLRTMLNYFSSSFKTALAISVLNVFFLIVLNQVVNINLRWVTSSLIFYFLLTSLTIWRRSLFWSFLIRWLIWIFIVLFISGIFYRLASYIR